MPHTTAQGPLHSHGAALVRAVSRGGLALALLGGMLFPLLSCAGFFSCEGKTSCPSTGGTGTTTVDDAFVSYAATDGTSYLTALNLSAGTLATVKTYTLPYLVAGLAVAPSNNFLYVASVPGYASPGIYLYSIASDGSLTAAYSNALVLDTIGAMTLSADGKYLFTLNSLGAAMTEYSVNTSTGALTAVGALSIPSLNCAIAPGTPASPSCAVAASPNNNFVVASLGTQGDIVFPYTSTAGISATGAYTIPSGSTAANPTGDFSVAIDSGNTAYVGQTGGVTAYGLAAGGYSNRGTVTYAGGSIPRGVTIGPSSKFVFTANQGVGTISSFVTGTTTALSAAAGSPYTGPASVTALGVDSTGSYLLAAGYSATTGLQLFSIASTGVLAPIQSSGTTTATGYPIFVAMTH